MRQNSFFLSINISAKKGDILMIIAASEKEIKEFEEKFMEIKKMGYIKGLKPSTKGNAGLTYELLLGKDNDGFQIADYNGIEIKVKNNFRFRYRYITLFSLVPSNCFGLEIKKLRNCYGYNDNTFKDKKILMKSVLANKKTYLENGYGFQLKIKYDVEKNISLCV